jgi:chromate reductase
VSPLLKNTIDWLSRQHGDEAPMAAYKGKVAAVMAASPGGLGGIRALPHLRYILEGIGVIVVPETIALGGAYGAFDDDGKLVDERNAQRVAAIGTRLAQVANAL